MKALLEALQNKDKKSVKILSRKLFLTKDGNVNHAQINEFESYAPCKVSTFVLKEGMKSTLGGRIKYNDLVYSI